MLTTSSIAPLLSRCRTPLVAQFTRRHYSTILNEGSADGGAVPLTRYSLALRLLGASAFVFVFGLLCTVLTFPILDQILFPFAAGHALRTKERCRKYLQIDEAASDGSKSNLHLFGREAEIAYLVQKAKETPNNVWLLTGDSQGTSTLSKAVADTLPYAMYLDFRTCTGALATIQELCYQMYRPLGIKGVAMASYFKLFHLFASVMTSLNGQQHTCMFNMYELFVFLHKGLKRQEYHQSKSRQQRQYPVIFIDHFDTIIQMYDNTKDKTLHDVFAIYIQTVAAWALSVCHDQKLAHVVFVTSSQSNAESYLKRLPGISERSETLLLRGFSPETAAKYLDTFIQPAKKQMLFEAISKEDIVRKIGCRISDLEVFVAAINRIADKDVVTQGQGLLGPSPEMVNPFYKPPVN